MRIRLSAFLLAALLISFVAQTAAPDTNAAKALAAHLDGLKETHNLEARFLCEKRLAALETPLVSSGRLWIRKGDPREGEGAVRFSTEKPYVSELILAKGKVIVRSQHETEWTKTNQSNRPGLTAIMVELGGWSTGDAGKIGDMYSIAISSDPVPDMPAARDGDKADAVATDNFVLTPTNKDLAKAVKRVTLAIDRATHHLRFIEILTQQDDVTRYWFYDVKANVALPADVFSPTAGPAPDFAATAPASAKP